MSELYNLKKGTITSKTTKKPHRLNSVVFLCVVGGHTVGWTDLKCVIKACESSGVSAPWETQDRAHPLHDGVVHVCVFQNSTLGICAQSVGHVPVWRSDSLSNITTQAGLSSPFWFSFSFVLSIGVKIIFRVGLVLLKCMLGSREKQKACPGQYETMEILRALEPRCMQEGFLIRQVANARTLTLLYWIFYILISDICCIYV